MDNTNLLRKKNIILGRKNNAEQRLVIELEANLDDVMISLHCWTVIIMIAVQLN